MQLIAAGPKFSLSGSPPWVVARYCLFPMKKLSRQTPNTFESIKQPKFRTIEATELERVHGGLMATTITLSTITVTPTGSSNDGDDSYAGEDASQQA